VQFTEGQAFILSGRVIHVKNGKRVSFWLDPWLENIPLCQSYPVLSELALEQNSSVFKIWEKGWVVQFRIRLNGIIRALWYELAPSLMGSLLMRGLMLSNGNGVPIRNSLSNQFMNISPKKIGVTVSRGRGRLKSQQKSKPSCGWWSKMPS
jgi:hypothetical protein